MIPTTTNPNPDWFEFLLDFSLLDKHLKSSSPEPSACSLIIQFLYHANMTEQLYNAGLKPPDEQAPNQSSTSQTGASPTPAGNSNQVLPQSTTQSTLGEVKLKRIKALRLLAIKTAAILNWDLLKFEKELPIAVISDLLNIYLRVVMNDCTNELKQMAHSQLDLKSELIEPPTLFALYILHRWCLRAYVFAKFPKKPPTKLVPINVPGALNPLQHMKEANESIMKMLNQSVQESVEFLEKCVKELDKKLIKADVNCFGNICSDDGDYELIWDNGIQIEPEFAKNMISYDLATYFFQMENYQSAYSYLKQVNEFKSSKELSDEFKVYTRELDQYLFACRAMLRLDTDITIDPIAASSDSVTKSVLTKILTIDTSLTALDYNKIYEIFLEDNRTQQLSLSYRNSIETTIVERFQPGMDKQFVDEILSANLVRLIVEPANFQSANYNISGLVSLGNAILDFLNHSLTPQHLKLNLITFVKRYSNQLSPETKSRLAESKNSQLNFLIDKSEIKTESYQDGDQSMPIDDNTTPSSPPPDSSIVMALNLKDSTNLTFARLALQTCDPIILKNCVNKYNSFLGANNQPTCTTSLRSFWPKWQIHASKLTKIFNNQVTPNTINSSYNDLITSNLIVSAYLTTSLKLTTLNDMDFFYISYAKINHLISIGKFDAAQRLLQSHASVLLASVKSSNKHVENQQLYWNIQHFLAYMEVSESSMGGGSRRQQQEQQFVQKNTFNFKSLNQEQLIKACKTFMCVCKSEPDISIEVYQSVMAFLLSVGEFGLLCSNEFNLFSIHQYHGKKHQNFINNPIYITYSITKNLSKLCLELNKSASNLDRDLQKKIARDMWYTVVDLFTDNIVHQQQPGSPSDPSSNDPKAKRSNSPRNTTAATMARDLLIQNRQHISSFLMSIKHKLVRNIIISMLTCISYATNVESTGHHAETTKSDLKYLWPLSSQPNFSFNIPAFQDLLNKFLANTVEVFDPFNPYWLRVYADLQLSRSHHSDSLKYYLKCFVVETRHFFRHKILVDLATTSSQHQPHQAPANKSSNATVLDEKCVKQMIRSLYALSKHTQAALMCQMLYNNNEYTTAFKYLQESNVCMPSSDDMDSLYECVWDMAMLEYLTHLNNIRGYLNKRNAVLKLIQMPSMNLSNPKDVSDKTRECKMALLFLKLVNHYFL